MSDLQVEPTPLERATSISAAHYNDDAYFEAYIEGVRAGTWKDPIESCPHQEATDPVKWAGWYRGYWRATQTGESGS